MAFTYLDSTANPELRDRFFDRMAARMAEDPEGAAGLLFVLQQVYDGGHAPAPLPLAPSGLPSWLLDERILPERDNLMQVLEFIVHEQERSIQGVVPPASKDAAGLYWSRLSAAEKAAAWLQRAQRGAAVRLMRRVDSEVSGRLSGPPADSLRRLEEQHPPDPEALRELFIEREERRQNPQAYFWIDEDEQGGPTLAQELEMLRTQQGRAGR